MFITDANISNEQAQRAAQAAAQQTAQLQVVRGISANLDVRKWAIEQAMNKFHECGPLSSADAVLVLAEKLAAFVVASPTGE